MNYAPIPTGVVCTLTLPTKGDVCKVVRHRGPDSDRGNPDGRERPAALEDRTTSELSNSILYCSMTTIWPLRPRSFDGLRMTCERLSMMRTRLYVSQVVTAR